MVRENQVYVVGKQGSLLKTLMKFSFSDKNIVWSWNEPRTTIDGRYDFNDIHCTYHESGEVTFTYKTKVKTKKYVHHRSAKRHQPLSHFKGPILLGVALIHYLDFDGFPIKSFDPRRPIAEKIVIDIGEENYLGLKIWAYLLDRVDDEKTTIHSFEDGKDVYLVKKVSPWLKLEMKRLEGIEWNGRSLRIA